MEDEQAAYVILGAELQSDIHYAALVKEMLYDAMQYSKQVEEARKSYREAEKTQKINKVTAGEFLSGFHWGDRLIPVVTLMIYFGPDEWDAPVTLHEMFSVQNDKILNYVSDYRINLISPAAMSEEEIDKFQTSLREVMLYIKYSQDKDKLRSILKRDENFKCMERKTIEVINAVTNSKLKVPEKKGSANVCQAIDDMCRDAKEDGLKQNTINILNRKLMEDNRMDDFKRSLTDAKFQRKLLEEYKIS